MKRTQNNAATVAHTTTTATTRKNNGARKPAEQKSAATATAPAAITLTDEQKAIALSVLYILDRKEIGGVKQLTVDKTSDADRIFIKAADGLDDKASKRATGRISTSARRVLKGTYHDDIHGYSWSKGEFAQYMKYYKALTHDEIAAARAEHPVSAAVTTTEQTAAPTTPQPAAPSASNRKPANTKPSEPTMTVAAAKALLRSELRKAITTYLMSDDAINARVEEAFKNVC